MSPAFDAEAYRDRMRDQWERSAAGWAARREWHQRDTLPVSRWLIDAIMPQPGHVVLELAAGPGDTGLLVAELVAPGGSVILGDFAPAMLASARERAEALGLHNVSTKALELEWLDQDAASVDAIVCRWGFMLAADPETALREARRVLRPGGRLALAAWAEPAANPWATIPTDALLERGLAPPRPQDPTQPGMFAFAPDGRLAGLLDDAGFVEHEQATVDFDRHYDDVDDYLAGVLDLSRSFADALERLDADGRAAVEQDVRARVARFADADGRVVVPARALVGAATG